MIKALLTGTPDFKTVLTMIQFNNGTAIRKTGRVRS